MQRILLTGAGGNVGSALLRHFRPGPGQQSLRGTRQHRPGPGECYFDFEDLAGSAAALEGVDTLFLLRPPQLADIPRYFAPLVDLMVQKGVRQVVFLSVQGADKTAYLPHAKIERLLRRSGLQWTFVRPSYFMQNLETTLRDDVRTRGEIFLPAGKLPFLWVDADDIGRAIAVILQNPGEHAGRIYTVTGSAHIAFPEVAQLLTHTLGRPIRYRSPGPLRFYRTLRRRGAERSFILVLLLLHWLPRFQALAPLSGDFRQLTGREPGTLAAYIDERKAVWDRTT